LPAAEGEQQLAALQAIAVPYEPHPAKVNWNC
jgi:hypothetical protein